MPANKFDLTCFGAAHVDLIAKAGETLVPNSSTPGRITRAVGGVAANVARQLTRQNVPVAMVSQVGQDVDGDFVCQRLAQAGVNTDQIMRTESETTGCYLAIEDSAGDLAMAVSDTHALLSMKPGDLFEAALRNVSSRYWFLDANLTPDMIDGLTAIENHPPIAIDAVSVSKATRLRNKLRDYGLIFCNLDEAEALLDQKFNSSCEAGQALAALAVQNSIITNGPHPLSVQTGTVVDQIEIPAVEVSSVTGAGDALIAGTLAGLVAGQSLMQAAAQGISTAADQLRGQTS